MFDVHVEQHPQPTAAFLGLCHAHAVHVAHAALAPATYSSIGIM